MTGRPGALLCASVLVLSPLKRGEAQGGLEIRAGGVTVVSRRSAMFDGTVGTASGLMPGGELLVRLRFVGLAARLVGGTFSADSGSEAVGGVHAGEVRVLAGPRFLSADVGYGRRAFSGALGGRSWPFAHLGLRSTLAIGASGFAAEVLMAYYADLSRPDGAGRGSGRAAETRLVYAPGRLPFYLAVGYRHERVTVPSAAEERPEEVSGVVVAAGLRLGS